jgi:methionyl-tRNA formyltransferase
MNVLLVAEESAGLQALRMLIAMEQSVAGVLTSDTASSRGASVGDFAKQSGVHVLASDLVKKPEFAAWMTENEVDMLLNVHSLFLITADVIAAPRIGSFNLHPGPLPEYAGLNAPSWAIYYGETRHAVTLHWMDPAIDTGAIAYAAAFDLTEGDTGLSASAKCVRHGLPLVERVLNAAEEDPAGIPAIAQDLSRRRYFGREAPQDGRLEWDRPAREIVNFVRAADYSPFRSPWGHPTTMVAGRTIGVVRAERTGSATAAPPGTVRNVDGAVHVAAADEWVAVTRVHIDARYTPADAVLADGSRLVES